MAICELALTGEDREYELRAPAEWNPTGRPVERFDDALTAFQRHAMIERAPLDRLCHEGDIGWLRLSPRPRDADAPAGAPNKATPISVVNRHDLGWLLDAFDSERVTLH